MLDFAVNSGDIGGVAPGPLPRRLAVGIADVVPARPHHAAANREVMRA
jgi:hypothetical protein